MVMEEDDPKRDPSLTVHNFIDKHLREIKWISFALGGAAVFILFRSVRATQKFTRPYQIPERFILNSNTLQGIVKHVTDVGTMQIEHIPILQLRLLSKILRNASKNDQHEYLSVKPAGIEVTADGIKWLKSNTVGKHAWFQMFERDSDNLYCDVHIRTGRFFRSSICSDLMKQGFGNIAHFEKNPEGDAFNQYLSELIVKEKIASKKKRGVWKEEKQGLYTSIQINLSKKKSNLWRKVKIIFQSPFGKKDR